MLYTMQVTELLKEVRVDYKETSGVEAHLLFLKKFLEKLPSDEVWCCAGLPILLYLITCGNPDCIK